MNKKVIHQFKIKQKKANKIKEYLPQNGLKKKTNSGKDYYNSYLEEKNPYYEKIIICFAIYCWIWMIISSPTTITFKTNEIYIILKPLYIISVLIPVIRLMKFYLDFQIPRENLFKNFLKDVFLYYIILELSSFVIFGELFIEIRKISLIAILFYNEGILLSAIFFSGMFIYSGIKYFKTMSVNEKNNPISLIIKIIIFVTLTSIFFRTLQAMISSVVVPNILNDIGMCLQDKVTYPKLFLIVVTSTYLAFVFFRPYYKKMQSSVTTNQESFINLRFDIFVSVCLTILLLNKDQIILQLLLGVVIIVIRFKKFYRIRCVNADDYIYEILRILIGVMMITSINHNEFTFGNDFLEIGSLILIDIVIWIIFKLKRNKVKINFNISWIKVALILMIFVSQYEKINSTITTSEGILSGLIDYWKPHGNYITMSLKLVLFIILVFIKKPTKDEIQDTYSEVFQLFVTTCLVYIFLTLFPNGSEFINYGNDNFPNLIVSFLGCNSLLIFFKFLKFIEI